MRFVFSILILFFCDVTARAQPAFTRSGDATINNLSAQTITNGTLTGTDLSAGMYRSGTAGFARSLRAKFAETFDVADAGAMVDGATDDTAAITKVITAANAAMAAGRSVAIYFPPGNSLVGALPSIKVPQGIAFGLFGSPGGSSVTETQSGMSPVTIAEVKSNAPTGQFPVTVSDISFHLGNAVVAGNAATVALDLVGLPILNGGGGMRPTVQNITCFNNGTTAVVWYACVKFNDVSHAAGRHIDDEGAGTGNGDPTQGIAVWLYTTPDAATSNYSVDDHFDDISLTGGFAGFRVDNHVEGLQVANATFVGSAYGVYAPVWALTNGQGGLLWSTFVTSHMNTQIAGIYCEKCVSMKVTNDLFYASSPVTLPSGATLPVDFASFAAGHANAWAAIWCPSCTTAQITSNDLYGFLRAQQPSTAIYLDAYDFSGKGQTLSDIYPTTITGNIIQAMSAGAMQVASAFTKLVVSDNVLVATTVPLAQFLTSAAQTSNNSQDGAIADIGFQNGTAAVNGALNVGGAIAATGTITAPSVTVTANVQGQNLVTPGALALKDSTAGTTLLVTGANGAMTVQGGVAAQALSLTSNGGLSFPAMNGSQPVLQTSGDGRLNINTGAVINGRLTATGVVQLASYKVASLPTGCTAGQLAYASDGRKTGEAAGAGSGVTVVCTALSASATAGWVPLQTATAAVAN